MTKSNIHTLSTRAQVQEEASLWITRLDRGLTLDEMEAFRAWLKQGDSHRDVLFELAELWDDLCVLNQLSSLFPFDPAILPPRRGQNSFLKLGVAACVILCLSLSLLRLVDPQTNINGIQRSEVVEQVRSTPHAASYPVSYPSSHTTLVGENRVVTLSDGSSVHLNTNSRIEISFNDEQRLIELIRGEARFAVAKDTERPFIVQAGESTVRALGTVFNVEMANETIEVIVTEGKVVISQPEMAVAERIVILPGQWATIDKEGVKEAISLSLELVQKELAWRDGMLIFRGESLSEAVVEIARYTDTSLRVLDQKAGSQKIAGFFKAGDIDGLLSSLTENFPLTYTRIDGEIVISSAELEPSLSDG
ncbi:MAG: transmembrane sensor [Litorivivens sp.]|jgi:transmembrane sensor